MAAANDSDANRKVEFEKILWPQRATLGNIEIIRYLFDKTHSQRY